MSLSARLPPVPWRVRVHGGDRSVIVRVFARPPDWKSPNEGGWVTYVYESEVAAADAAALAVLAGFDAVVSKVTP